MASNGKRLHNNFQTSYNLNENSFIKLNTIINIESLLNLYNIYFDKIYNNNKEYSLVCFVLFCLSSYFMIFEVILYQTAH